jgi:hypothetical protein
MKRFTFLVLIANFALAERLPSENPLTVHEWGTFTSVTRLDGRAAVWAPLQGPGDLPCFVERLGQGNYKLFYGMVRMETPVLYFYARSPLTLSVKVDFPKGWVTEWFPKASTVMPRAPDAVSPGNGSIVWDKVEVLPHSTPNLWTTQGASHYFAARNTDAAPVRIGGQWEKLIFYRGVGNFKVPLRVTHNTETHKLSIHGNFDHVVSTSQEAKINGAWLVHIRSDGKTAFRRIDDVMLKCREQKRAQFPAQLFCRSEGVLLDERGKKALREIFRILRRAPESARKGVKRRPVIVAHLRQRRVPV